MKKVFMLALALLSMTFASAQNDEAIKESAERVAKLLNLEVPKQTKLEAVNTFIATVNDATKQVTTNSQTMQDYYTRMQTADGTNVLAPSLEEWQTLASNIKEEKNLIEKAKTDGEEAGKAAVALKDEATNISNPLKAAKAVKEAKNAMDALNYGKQAIPLLGEEMVAQGKIVTSIITSMSSGQ